MEPAALLRRPRALRRALCWRQDPQPKDRRAPVDLHEHSPCHLSSVRAGLRRATGLMIVDDVELAPYLETLLAHAKAAAAGVVAEGGI